MFRANTQCICSDLFCHRKQYGILPYWLIILFANFLSILLSILENALLSLTATSCNCAISSDCNHSFRVFISHSSMLVGFGMPLSCGKTFIIRMPLMSLRGLAWGISVFGFVVFISLSVIIRSKAKVFSLSFASFPIVTILIAINGNNIIANYCYCIKTSIELFRI